MLLPRVVFEGSFRRILHDRTGDRIAELIGEIPNATATIVPFPLGKRRRRLAFISRAQFAGPAGKRRRPMAAAMGAAAGDRWPTPTARQQNSEELCRGDPRRSRPPAGDPADRPAASGVTVPRSSAGCARCGSSPEPGFRASSAPWWTPAASSSWCSRDAAWCPESSQEPSCWSKAPSVSVAARTAMINPLYTILAGELRPCGEPDLGGLTLAEASASPEIWRLASCDWRVPFTLAILRLRFRQEEPYMAKPLVIVESPAKAKTIAGFLGKDYVVESSIGHIRDLPRSAADIPAAYKGESWARLGVDVDNDFKPLYVVARERQDQVKRLQALGEGRE